MGTDHAPRVAGPLGAREGRMGMEHDSHRTSAPVDHLRCPGLGAAAGHCVLVALALALIGAGATGAAFGADPTASPPPLAEGRHVQDDGEVLTPDEAARAEAFAARIESAGGGRVVVYTEPDPAQLPDASTIAARWDVDGLLVSGSGGSMTFLRATMGDTLKRRLDADQLRYLSDNMMSGVHSAPGWTMSTLSRVDAFLGGRHVFDGAGVLDGTGIEQAETAATNLGSQLGAPVYIDIASTGSDPTSEAVFNSSSRPGRSLVIALAVSDGRVGGRIGSDSSLWDRYQTGEPWSGDSLSTRAVPDDDRQAVVLAAISAVEKPPLITVETALFFALMALVIILALAATFSTRFRLAILQRFAGTSGPIASGVTGTAVIVSIADTGTTISAPAVGPDAPVYKLGLQVSRDGGAPYPAEAKMVVPRIFVPLMVPGTQVPVVIDHREPARVSIDFERFGQGSEGDEPGAARPGSMDISFDAAGQPDGGDLSAMAGAIGSGSMPVIKGSADLLLRTGTPGTATVTTAQPLGKKVRDVNPAADPSRLDDPVWLFTVEVTLAGQAPFPAVFGHRVPVAKVAQVEPGAWLVVAVDERDRNEEVAIDWDRSPLTS
jgi:hypothetical protein